MFVESHGVPGSSRRTDLNLANPPIKRSNQHTTVDATANQEFPLVHISPKVMPDKPENIVPDQKVPTAETNNHTPMNALNKADTTSFDPEETDWITRTRD